MSGGRRPRRRAVLLVRRFTAPAVLAALSTAGCAGDHTGSATAAAVGFHSAVARGDGARACALLAPQTVQELEQSAQQSCERAVVEEDIPAVGQVQASELFDTQALVRFAQDTVFLARFPAGWKVVAAACSPRPPLPYDCQVKGI
jgi:hypothetical protein